MAKILVVDDRPINRQFLVALLGYMGHQLFEAGDGVEALAAARRELPALIILDLYMPGMDGYEFLQIMRDDPRLGSIPVIFYTAAYNEREARALGRGLGVTEVITKPSAPETILERVSAVLERNCVASDSSSELAETSYPEELVALQTISLRLTALIELGMELVSEHDPHEQMQRFCLAARRIIGAEFAALGLLSFQDSSLEDFLVSGDGLLNINPRPPRLRDGVLGKILNERRAFCLTEFSDDQKVDDLLPDGSAPRSFLGVPVLSSSCVYGWLYLINKVDGTAFTREDERLAVTLAAQAGVAFENTQLISAIEQKALEIDKSRRLQLELKNQFLSHVSHELRTPLATIHQFISILLDGLPGELNQEQNDYLNIMLRNADSLCSMIDDLLEVSRAEEGRVKIERKWVSAVSLVTHAAECHRVRAAERDIELTVDISGDLPEIFVDSRKIGQVLSNLLDNATKFTSAGGSITLTAVTDLGFLQFSVLNTGCGIDPAAVPHIFERFYQEDSHPDSKRKGLGLGLYICKEIVELHGGRIWVENESGKGCRFVFALPNHEGGRTELHDLSPVVSEINDFTFARN